MKQLIAAAFAACLLASPVSAQTTDFFILPDNAIVEKGQMVCVPIRVQGFTDMVALTFALNWDPQVLTFHHTQAYELPTWDTASYAVNQATGRLAVLMGAPFLQGVNRPDGTALFEVCFEAIGDNNDCTSVVPNGNGFLPSVPPGEASTTDGTNHWTTSSGIAGHVCIQGSVSTHETNAAQTVVKTYPNPAADWLTVAHTEAFSGEALRFEVLDLMGKKLSQAWLSGEKTKVSLEDLPAGMYLWQLHSSGQVLQTGRIVRQ